MPVVNGNELLFSIGCEEKLEIGNNRYKGDDYPAWILTHKHGTG